ncbi:MAG: hypothetical protein AMXMBFR84_06660 [Candidatus Hydrogenedentota bacterium]
MGDRVIVAPTGEVARVVHISGGKYIEIPISSLRVDSVTNFDLYLRTQEDLPPVLFREKHLPFTQDVLGRLAELNHSHMWVRDDEHDVYQQYVEKHLESILGDSGVPITAKSKVLYSSATGLMRRIFENPGSGELVTRSQELAGKMTKFLASENRAFHHLMGLVSYDYYTYTHSVNVYVYSVCLAQKMGLTDPALLREFGEGLLLHDIGKSRIDPEIVNSKGRLTDDQWKHMRLHPVHGYDILMHEKKLGPMALDVVRHHHEKLNGNGYPDGLQGKKISEWVRISTICDVFDALTTKRSYKEAMQTYKALTIMRDEMSHEIDQNIFRVFVGMLASPDK